MPKGSSSTRRCYLGRLDRLTRSEYARGSVWDFGGNVKPAAVFTLVAVLAVAAAGLALASRQAVERDPVLRRGQEVPICHATHLKSHPYVSLSPDVDGILDGHDGH